MLASVNTYYEDTIQCFGELECFEELVISLEMWTLLFFYYNISLKQTISTNLRS